DTFFIVICVIMLMGFTLRVYGLSSQPLSDDDRSVAVSALNYFETGHLGPTMWNHPKLRNIFVYLTMHLFGPGVWGLKMASLILGTMSILILGLLTNRLINKKEVAYIAAFFLAIDPLHIDFSRQAVHEVYMAFFSLAGVYFALKFMDKQKSHMLIFSAIFFGLGMASKWNVVFSLFVTYIALISRVIISPSLNKSEKTSDILFISSSLIVLPFSVYMLTFAPWFYHGHDIPEWIFLHKAMYQDIVTHRGYLQYSLSLDHKPYLWFIRPVAFADLALSEGRPSFLIGISNPFVWLLTIPSTLFLFYKCIYKKATGLYILLGLFLFNYLPFVLAGRPVWALTALTVIPFAFAAVAYAIYSITIGCKHRKMFLLLYLLIVTIVNIPLYILATGKGMNYTVLKPIVHMYKPSNELLRQMKNGMND
ncbi:MAG: glycosyltransferase family 39 protein, partial [Desulfobacteraceae bacterium]|nr:glycosyltransferase family 39 protein [Desulfobacteraceae bacterium]